MKDKIILIKEIEIKSDGKDEFCSMLCDGLANIICGNSIINKCIHFNKILYTAKGSLPMPCQECIDAKKSYRILFRNK